MTTRVSYNLKDALLIKETALPNSGTIYSDAFDLECIGQRGVRIDPFELLITAPAADASELPNNARNTFYFQFCDDPEFVPANVRTITGGTSGIMWRQDGSAEGAEEYELRFRTATDAPRYVRAMCVVSGNAAQEGKTFQFAIVT